mmetsp:Transcript_127085/g.367891  ORF Transcript_127085/g.367891 Transcript_127085/m.367891 type:complete len:103 (+) Transcript_127085:2734-3042(+)
MKLPLDFLAFLLPPPSTLRFLLGAFLGSSSLSSSLSSSKRPSSSSSSIVRLDMMAVSEKGCGFAPQIHSNYKSPIYEICVAIPDGAITRTVDYNSDDISIAK